MIFGHAPSFGRVIFGYIKGTRYRILSFVTTGEEMSEKYMLMNTCRGGTKRTPLANPARPSRWDAGQFGPSESDMSPSTQPSLRTACMHLGKYLPVARY